VAAALIPKVVAAALIPKVVAAAPASTPALMPPLASTRIAADPTRPTRF
jgi:hypothetical protein